jgi:hypothetical protein
MRSSGVVEGHVLVQNAPQMPLAKEHELIETFLKVAEEGPPIATFTSFRRGDYPARFRMFLTVVLSML